MNGFAAFVDHDLPSPGLAPVTCPFCGEEFDGATGITDVQRPRTGDAMLCFYCVGLAVYGSDGYLHEPTEEQAAVFADDTSIAHARKTMHAYLDRNPDMDRRAATD